MLVTWNGTVITGPVFIYQDEILVDTEQPFTIGDRNRNGSLVSSWPNGAATVKWRTPSGQVPAGYIAENREIKQIRTGNVSRLSANSKGIALMNEDRNGLWTCRGPFTPVPVGIYGRNTGTLIQVAV